MQKFVNVFQQRFALIDVKKNQRDTRKETKKGKESVLDLHNEIKIITSSEEVFSLWSELISKYSHGNLVDPETCEKMKLNSRWIPQKDRILNREFFKWLGNCDEEDHRKLCLHLLHCSGPMRTLRYPRVTIKQTSKVLKDCYSAREWLGGRKRKALVKKELHKLNPSLGLMDKEGCLQKDHWKQSTMSQELPCAFYWRLPGRITSLQQRRSRTRISPLKSCRPMQSSFSRPFSCRGQIL